jgi:hypothetical protein
MAILLSFSVNEKSLEGNMIFKPLAQVIKSPPFKSEYIFAGERVPVESSDIMERLDRELINNSYGHSSTMQSMKLSARFFPVISRILSQFNIPDDIKYIAVAESGLRNVTSPADAKGYWQFMTPTAKEMGLIVTNEVDERYHIEKSTEAAAKYLLELKSRFGTWTDAAAAYNMGMTRYKKTMEDQLANNFFELNLNQETMRYYFRLVAIKEVFENPVDFGFYLEENEKYTELKDYDIIKIDTSIASLAQFARDHNISYRTLKYYNPWLISDKLTVRNDTFFIKIHNN